MSHAASKTDRSKLLTEQRLAASMNLDRMPLIDALRLFNEQDARAVAAVANEIPQIVRAVEIVSDALAAGGRLIYIGAGTSGRLGVLDAAECPPTFSSDPEKILGIIAGGREAMFRSAEGAEDHESAGAAAVDEQRAADRDVIFGIAAGGTTPFVRGALARATSLGCKTIFLCCVQPSSNEPQVDLIIRPLVGPEILTGSTRLKAGTATKLILNQITTLSMARLGKVYENLMIDLRASNTKLRDRAIRIVGILTKLDVEQSAALLASAGGSVKAAIVMHRRNLDLAGAEELLARSGGNLRRAMGE